MDWWFFWLGKIRAAPWKMQQKSLRGCSGYAYRFVLQREVCAFARKGETKDLQAKIKIKNYI